MLEVPLTISALKGTPFSAVKCCPRCLVWRPGAGFLLRPAPATKGRNRLFSGYLGRSNLDSRPAEHRRSDHSILSLTREAPALCILTFSVVPTSFVRLYIFMFELGKTSNASYHGWKWRFPIIRVIFLPLIVVMF